MQKIALSVLSVVFALAIVEIGLRAFAPQYQTFTRADERYRFWFIPDATYHFIAPENCPGWSSSGVINSKGLRDYEYDYDKPPDTYRILALGDSYTEALQFDMEQGWTKRLEQKLNATSNDSMRYEVMNAGRSGMGTGIQHLFYTYEGYKYKPDLVILLTTWNDIQDNIRSNQPYFILEDGALRLQTAFVNSFEYKLRKHTEWLREHFYLWGMLRQELTPLVRSLLDSSAADEPAQTIPSTGENPATVTLEQMLERPAVKLTEQLLLELYDAVQKNGSDFLVVLGSNSNQVNWNVASQRDKSRIRLTDTDLIIGQIAVKNRLPYLDLVPILREFSEQNQEWIHGCEENRGGGHWSKVGHQIAADAIYDYLVNQAEIMDAGVE